MIYLIFNNEIRFSCPTTSSTKTKETHKGVLTVILVLFSLFLSSRQIKLVHSLLISPAHYLLPVLC